MGVMRQIWSDIRHGESIDLYATIVIAFVVVVLSLFGFASPMLVQALTLTVLGLLAISNLVNRYRLEQLAERVVASTEDLFMDEFPTRFKSDFESVKEAWLIGVTLRKTITEYSTMIEDKLRKGHRLRVLLVHPEGAAIEMAGSRYVALVPTGGYHQSREKQVKDSLAWFCGLRRIAGDRLEIRTIHNPLTFGATCLEPETASGILYLEYYPFRTTPNSVPKLVLRAVDGRWYDFFKKEVQMLWDSGQEWPCESMELVSAETGGSN